MTVLCAVQCIKPHPAGNCWIGTGVDQAFGNLVRALINVIAQGCVTDMSLIMTGWLLATLRLFPGVLRGRCRGRGCPMMATRPDLRSSRLGLILSVDPTGGFG
jgi:hypothetical protein